MPSDRSLGHQWGKERENMGLVQHLSLGVLQDPENNFGPRHSCYGPTSPCHSPAFLLLAALRNEGVPRNGNHMIKGMRPNHSRFSIH